MTESCQQVQPNDDQEQCPMLAPGGVRCRHRATVVPQAWEVPSFCVPGKQICACCYESLREQSGIRGQAA